MVYTQNVPNNSECIPSVRYVVSTLNQYYYIYLIILLRLPAYWGYVDRGVVII